jgi:hypothetical protein
MDAGDMLKFTATTGYAAALLQLAARLEPPRAAALNAAADVGVRWLLKAHPPGSDIFVLFVGDEDADHNRGFGDPAADDGSADARLAHRPVHVLTPEYGGSDAAGQAAAALALAAQHEADPQRQALLVQAAREWLAAGRTVAKVWQEDFYPTEGFRDDLAFGAAELFRATGDGSEATAALTDIDVWTKGGEESWRVTLTNDELAALPAAELCGRLDLPAVQGVEKACDILAAGLDDVRDHVSPFGLATSVDWGTLRNNAAGGVVALTAGDAAIARGAQDYFLGRNPWGVRFQAGYGVKHPHHWLSRTGTNAPKGAVVGGPGPVKDSRGTGLKVVRGPYDTGTVLYRDKLEDYVTNEVGIAYSAPAVLLAALLSPA